MSAFRIETERLVLRGWRAGDAATLHAMGQDPRVMAHLGPLYGRAEAEAMVARQQDFQARLGHCFWALEQRADGAVIGFCGLKPGPAGTPLAGGVEIGWRLAHAVWGRGYAREAAGASLAWGFANLPDPAIWAMTVLANHRSWGLMERLGMERMAALDFDHPALAPGDPLRPHIVYRAAR